MHFYSILWRAVCSSPSTVAGGPFIWRLMGQFAVGARFINLAVGSASQFYRMQLQYRVCKNNSKRSCMQFFYYAPYKNYKILFQTKLGCSGKGIYEAHGRSGRQTKRDST